MPSWVWDLYSPTTLVTRVQEELSKLSSLSPNLASLPSDPTQLSWWATANLPFQVSFTDIFFILQTISTIF